MFSVTTQYRGIRSEIHKLYQLNCSIDHSLNSPLCSIVHEMREMVGLVLNS